MKNVTIRKQFNRLGRTLLFYELAMLVAAMLYYVVYTVIEAINTGRTVEQIMEVNVDRFAESGWPSLAGIALGMIFIVWYRRKDSLIRDLTVVNRQMDRTQFIKLLFCFMAVQGLFLCGTGLELLLNYFGYTMESQMESATSVSTNVSMFLYASVLGPVAEEVVFRGAVLRSLQKYGNKFAIVVSAVMFGVFHANFLQGLFAAVVGLVLGYVAAEYSLKWAIVLHMINNLLFVDGTEFLIRNLSEQMQNIINYGIVIFFLAGGLYVLVSNRKAIGSYLSENKTEKGLYFRVFTSVWILLFLLVNLLMSLTGIEKIAG